MRNFSAAGERRSELAGGPGLAGGSFWIKTEWCRLRGGGKSATDCGESSGGVVVKAGVLLRVETYLETRPRTIVFCALCASSLASKEAYCLAAWLVISAVEHCGDGVGARGFASSG